MSESSSTNVLTYSPDQIKHGLERAGNQCELHALDGSRCAETATGHVPFLTWVNGGEPPMDNFVAACPAHTAKYRKGLSFLRSIRIVRHRAKYFHQGERLAPEIIAAAILTTNPQS